MAAPELPDDRAALPALVRPGNAGVSDQDSPDPSWCARFVEELEMARAAYDPDEMAAQVTAWSAQIADAVAEDTRKPYSNSGHNEAVADLKDFLGARAEVVDAWLAEGGHCPARW